MRIEAGTDDTTRRPHDATTTRRDDDATTTTTMTRRRRGDDTTTTTKTTTTTTTRRRRRRDEDDDAATTRRDDEATTQNVATEMLPLKGCHRYVHRGGVRQGRRPRCCCPKCPHSRSHLKIAAAPKCPATPSLAAVLGQWLQPPAWGPGAGGWEAGARMVIRSEWSCVLTKAK